MQYVAAGNVVETAEEAGKLLHEKRERDKHKERVKIAAEVVRQLQETATEASAFAETVSLAIGTRCTVTYLPELVEKLWSIYLQSKVAADAR